jgi:hypothetical protein
MRIPTISIIALCLLGAAQARADRGVPYTDGRIGGCFINDSGFMHGCTPQPPKPSYERKDDGLSSAEVESGSRIKSLESRTRYLEDQNLALRREARMADDAARAKREEERRHEEVLDAYYSSQMQKEASERSAARYRKWNREHTGCDSVEYEAMLKSRGLMRHPSVQGICVSTPSKGGASTYAQECPPC